jgi:ElaB/YqjD/DUF883 family membrane-anchored ribosome-binding protein
VLADVSKNSATVEGGHRAVSKIRSIVADTVEDGVRSATQAIKRGRHAAEDAIDDAKHTVKQKPLQAMGTAFAAGVLAGSLLTLIGLHRR